MATQGGETDEEYSDDPIKLIDFEQKRINTLKIFRNNCQVVDLTESDVDVGSDSVPLSKYSKVCFALPASFLTITKNVELLNGCRPVAVKIVDCMKHRSYNKKNIRITDIDSDIIIVDDEINEKSVENVCESDIEDCVVISDSEKEESDISFDEQMGKPKIRPVDITSYIRNNTININNSVQRTSETLQLNKKCEKGNGVLQNENRIDFKKNKGLVGLRILQRANVDDRSKKLVGQKIVESVNVDKTKNCSNVEKKKAIKVDGKASQSIKPVHHYVNTSKVSSKSKLLESNTTEKSEKQPENNLSTSNIKQSITNKESLRPSNTNSSKVDTEIEKPSNVPVEINLTSKHDKQKSSTDTSEKRKNVEPSKTKKNSKKECISKYFKDVWDKDLRLALEPDTIQLKKLNSSLKYFKDKLKVDKRKSRKENTKCASNPYTDGKADHNKIIEKLKKTKKAREKSKKKDSTVSDITKRDSTHSKSMPSLLLDEEITTGKSQIEGNVSSKSTHKKTSEIISKNKCMGFKENSDVQPISNPKNRDIVINEKTQTCKDSSKFVMNQLATQNKQDKKAERKKNNSETANIASSILNYNLKRDVIDKDKPMSTSTVHNQINPGIVYKDKTSTSIPTDVNKQLQPDKLLTSKPTATQQTINQNNSHLLNQKQNEDLYNKDRRKSESLSKYLFFLQSLNPNLVGGDLSLKHAVKPQECILSYVNGNQQVPNDPKTHTVSIGDVQNSSNSTGNNTSSATEPMNSQQIPNQSSNKGLGPPAQTMTINSTNGCNKPDAVKKSGKTIDDNMANSSMQDISANPNLAKKIDTAPSIKTNNLTNNCNKPDAVKKSGKTIDDNMINSSMQDISPNSNFAKKTDTAPSMKTNNLTNDCNKPDAIKKSDKTLDDNMTSSYMQDISPNSNLAKKIDTAPSIKTNNLTNDCNKPDAVKKSDKTFDDNMTNCSKQDIPPNPNRVKEIDTATLIKSKVSIKQEDPSESSYVPPIDPAQQTTSHGRIIEEYGEPIQAFVTNRKDYHQVKLGIAPQVNMKTIGNSNTFPQGVIHCAPIYHGAPQNMPQGAQNQFGLYHPPQVKHISHAQPPVSLPVPQMSQPLPQMLQFSPKILQHSQQMSQPSQQISQASRQMPQPSRQMPHTLPNILQHLKQMSQSSSQISQYPRQMPQPLQQMSQSLSQMSQTSPQILEHSQQMSQPSPQISQPSRQMPQPSRQMLQPSRQMQQPSRQMQQPSRQMPQSSQQMSRQPPQMSYPVPQMSLPPTQMWHSTPQISPQFMQVTPQISHNVQAPLWYPPTQMPPRSSQMYHPALQKSHSQLRMTPPPRHQMSNCNLRMSYPQTQNFDLYACEQSQIDFPKMSNLPPRMMHPPSEVLNRHQQMPHFLQCFSNHPQQVSHPLQTSSHTQKPTLNPSQQLSNPQSQISHLPQQLPNPPVKYDNVTQSVSGSTIIGRNNAGVVRKINIVAAHAKGSPSSTEAKSNNEDITPVESEQEMFEELCKITTLESPMKEDSKSKKNLTRQPSKDDKIDESTPNRRPRIGTILKKFDDALQDLKKSSERALPVPQQNGYSPPILPIATFEKTFEILAHANIQISDNRNYGPKIKWNPTSRKRRCVSFDERRDNAKKISIDEYNKRSTGKDDKAIDFVVQQRKDDQNGGQNPDQDLGYDSDTTMKQ